MLKTSPAVSISEISGLLNGAKGDSLPFRQIFDAIARAMNCAQVTIVSTLPRGGLQIVQPSNCPEILVKGYNRELHAEDRLTWQAVTTGKVVKGSTAYPDNTFESSRYAQELLEPAGLRCSAAAPLKAPVLSGYPGALHLYRKMGDPQFSEGELEAIGDIARQLDEAIEEVRQPRRRPDLESVAWSHYSSTKQLAFDAEGKRVLTLSGQPLDHRLIQQMAQHAQHRLASLGEGEIPADRLQLPDSRGGPLGFPGGDLSQIPGAIQRADCLLLSTARKLRMGSRSRSRRAGRPGTFSDDSGCEVHAR